MNTNCRSHDKACISTHHFGIRQFQRRSWWTLRQGLVDVGALQPVDVRRCEQPQRSAVFASYLTASRPVLSYFSLSWMLIETLLSASLGS